MESLKIELKKSITFNNANYCKEQSKSKDTKKYQEVNEVFNFTHKKILSFFLSGPSCETHLDWFE